MADSVLSGFHNDLLEELLIDQPKQLCLFGENYSVLATELDARSQQIRFYKQLNERAIMRASSDIDCRRAVALIMNAEREPLSDHALGTACRQFPWRVLVESDEDQRFLAFGFRRLARSNTQPGNARPGRMLYEYRLHDYKQAPEWLNSRFWAHPERFQLQDE